MIWEIASSKAMEGIGEIEKGKFCGKISLVKSKETSKTEQKGRCKASNNKQMNYDWVVLKMCYKQNKSASSLKKVANHWWPLIYLRISGSPWKINYLKLRNSSYEKMKKHENALQNIMYI